MIQKYQLVAFYVLCLSSLVLHVKCKGKMPLKQLEPLQC